MNWVQINRKRGNKTKFRAWGFQISLLFFLSCGSVYAQSQICITGTVTSGGDSNETYYCYSGFGSMDELSEFLGRNDPELGGGGFATPVDHRPKSVPNNRYNQNPATCNSDDYTRLLHAAGDFAAYRPIGWPGELHGRGYFMLIEFDDGSREIYTWTGSCVSTEPSTYLTPVPGSLVGCPATRS